MAVAMEGKRRVKTKAAGVYRSSSGRYEIAYRDSDGRQVFKTVDGSFEEAKAQRAEVVAKLGRGEQIRSTKTRFAEYADQVVDGLTTQRPGTIELHRYRLRVHLKPRFGNRRLADITTRDVARMVAELQKPRRTIDGKVKPPLAGWTINGIVQTLSLVLRKAKREGLVPSNPVADLDRDERPSTRRAEKRVLETDELERLLKHADGFRPLIATLLFTGLRLGEALGLRWEDVDTEAGLIHVRRQLDRQRQRVDIKTDAGRRDVVLIPQLARVLLEAKMLSPFKLPTDFVFSAPDGRGRDHRSTSRGIERAIERAKLGAGVSAHTFRHTYASRLIVELRLDPVSVSRQLGHTKASFTQDVYAHLFDRVQHADRVRSELAGGFGSLLGTSA